MRRVPATDDVTAAKAGDKRAVDRVLRDMTLIITFHAKRLMGAGGIEFDDLRQIGFLAVFDALKSFDAKFGRAFHWHATQWIRSRMGYAVKRQRSRPEVSMDTPLGDDIFRTIGDTLASHLPAADVVVEATDERERFHAHISAESDSLGRLVLRHRAQGLTLDEIGELTGYSRERIRQVLALNVARLKKRVSDEASA